MSGFLHRLAARQSAEPAIRPRVVPRFAWSAPSVGTWPSEGRSTPVTPALSQVLGVRIPALPSAETIGGPHVHEAPTPNHNDRSAPASERDSRPEAQPPNETTFRRVDRGRIDAAIAGITSPREAPGLAPRIEVSPPRAPAFPFEAPSVPVPRAPARSVRSRTEAPQPQRNSSREDASPEVVRVHIGRVEVRAILPAPERPRPASRRESTPALPLDQYLAGKRRRT
jgi:hypothetical protein